MTKETVILDLGKTARSSAGCGSFVGSRCRAMLVLPAPFGTLMFQDAVSVEVPLLGVQPSVSRNKSVKPPGVLLPSSAVRQDASRCV